MSPSGWKKVLCPYLYNLFLSENSISHCRKGWNENQCMPFSLLRDGYGIFRAGLSFECAGPFPRRRKMKMILMTDIAKLRSDASTRCHHDSKNHCLWLALNMGLTWITPSSVVLYGSYHVAAKCRTEAGGGGMSPSLSCSDFHWASPLSWALLSTQSEKLINVTMSKIKLMSSLRKWNARYCSWYCQLVHNIVGLRKKVLRTDIDLFYPLSWFCQGRPWRKSPPEIVAPRRRWISKLVCPVGVHQHVSLCHQILMAWAKTL